LFCGNDRCVRLPATNDSCATRVAIDPVHRRVFCWLRRPASPYRCKLATDDRTSDSKQALRHSEILNIRSMLRVFPQ